MVALLQLIQRQIRDNTATTAAFVLVEDDLVHPAEDALHRFKIKALANDLTRLVRSIILLIDRFKACGLTVSFGNDTGTITLSLLKRFGGGTTCTGDFFVEVPVSLVPQAVLILLCRLNVAEGVNIRVYGGGELVPPLEAFDAVRSGAAEAGSGAAYYWAGKDPATQFFASVPFGMNAQQLNAWILRGGGMELWTELYAQYGLVPMLGGNTGVQMGGWFNKEINTLEDLKGLKMRMPGLGGKVLEKAGGTPVLLPGGDLYTGLERGVIDATEWIGPYHDYKMGFHQIAKYYYTPGWHETGTALEFFFNKEKFDMLPPDIKAIMESAALRLNGWMLAEFETQNAIYLKKLLEEEKVEVRRYPDEVLTQLRIHTDEIIEEITQEHPFCKKVYASYDQFRKAATDWAALTEKVYYNSIQI